jgi:hypothetical protein
MVIGVAEWSMAEDCKSFRENVVGSNPTSCTIIYHIRARLVTIPLALYINKIQRLKTFLLCL